MLEIRGIPNFREHTTKKERKKMTKMRRMLSMMVSIILITGSVFTGLPTNGMLTRVEAASDVTIPFTLNFEDGTVNEAPKGWVEDTGNKAEDAGKSSMIVVEEESNKMLMLSQTGERASNYFMHYYFAEADKVVLKYRFKAKAGSGSIFLPTLAYTDDWHSPLQLRLYGTGITYSYYANTWLPAANNLKADEWHTVKFVVDLQNNVRELVVDDVQIALDETFVQENPCNVTKKMDSVELGFYKTTSGTFYIDDMSVETYVDGESVTFKMDNEPVTSDSSVTITQGDSVTLQPVFDPGNTSVQGVTYSSSDELVATVDNNGKITGIGAGEATITATPTLTNLGAVTITVKVEGEAASNVTIPFKLDFENETVDATPTGWVDDSGHKDADAGKSSMIVVEEEDNKMVMLNQNALRSSNYYMHYYFDEENKVVLKYRFKAEEESRDIWLPTLAYTDRNRSPLHLLLNQGGTQINYSYYQDTWKPAADNLTVGEWHTVKVVVDLQNNVRELAVDDVSIVLDETFVNDYPCEMNSKLNNVELGFYSGSASGTFYIDDMSVEAYVDGESVTFQEDVTVSKGGYVELQPVFTPANTSVQGVTYSSSDSSVATVDSNGKITGISNGQTTITATPTLDALGTATITVKVEGEVEGTISGVSDNITLVKGGHMYLNAGIEFSAGIQADDTVEYVSEDPETVTVDKWGEMLAKKVGSTTITITSVVNPTISKTINVNVEESSVVRTIYVSPTGTGDGKTEQTPTTLQGALEQLAAVDKDTLSGDIEVILADGYYRQLETLALNDSHGGNNNYSVIFKAAEDGNDEAPVIGGGISVAGSAFAQSSKAGVYEYNLNQLNLSFDVKTRQLYVNNVRATRARSEGTLTNAQFLYDSDGTTNIGMVCDNTELLNYAHPEDLEMVSFSHWAHQRCQVASVEPYGEGQVKLIMDQPGWGRLTQLPESGGLRPATIKYYENALELLDEPGEWYLDETAQKLYYMPRIWEDMDEVTFTIPVVDGEMITVIGTSSEKQVQNICFDGITFADTTWMRPSTGRGHAAAQNNYLWDKDDDTLVKAAVTVQKANSVQFLNCTFTRLGINAINMTTGVQNALIMGNHFYDISGNAIAIGKDDYRYDVNNYNPTDVKKMMKNCDVLNNYIHDIGVDYRSSSAVSVGFAANVDLCNNEIFNVPYCGFHIGYSWSATHKNITENMNISNNFIHDYMFDGIYDGGAIYTNGATKGWNIASGNYVRNQGDKPGALYPDEGSTNWKYTNNVVDLSENEIGYTSNLNINWGNVNIGGGNILMENNYTSIDRYKGEDAAKNIVFRNNTVVSDLNWPAEAKEIMAASGLQAAYSGLRNNQAERIAVSIPEAGLVVNVGDTYNIQVTFTDGKDNEITINQDDIIAYEIADKEVATVDKDGKITAIGKGQTKVFIHVVSNGILDTIERDIFVADEVEKLCLKNFDTEIKLYSTSDDLQLEPYGVTEYGREVSFETVTYHSNDTNVVTVDENGLLKVVGVGETTLLVTGKMSSESNPIEATFQIVVNKPISKYYPDEMFKSENEEKWQGGTKSWTLTPDQKIETEPNKYIYYAGQTYTNELLTFKMSVGAGEWPSIIFRAQSTNKCVALGETGYIICLKETGIELQRFNGSARTVFFGNVEGCTSIFGDIISPNPLADNELHEISVGALNEDDGVRLVMYIDGEEIFNVLDTSENAITNGGYFGLVGFGNEPFVLEKISPSYTAGLNTLSDEVSVGETVNVNVAVDHTTDTVFATGEVKITYDAAILSFNEVKSTINGATVKDDENGTLTATVNFDRVVDSSSVAFGKKENVDVSSTLKINGKTLGEYTDATKIWAEKSLTITVKKAEIADFDGDLINIGYMIFEPGIFEYIDGDTTIFERDPMNKLVEEHQLVGYIHKGFWQCMDTMREKQKLEKLWADGNAPWKVWKD